MGVLMPDSMGEDDVNQWLSEGYVLFDDRVLSYEGGYEVNEDGTYVVFKDLETSECRLIAISDIECYWPICGAINIQCDGTGVAVLVERTSARQWRRTFNPRGVEVRAVSSWGNLKRFGERRYKRVTHITRGMIQELFSPSYPTLAEAMRSISGKEAVSVAISPQVIVAGDAKGKYCVYYRASVVGSITQGEYKSLVEESFTSKTAAKLIQEGLRSENT